jgi:hypothetical protein
MRALFRQLPWLSFAGQLEHVTGREEACLLILAQATLPSHPAKLLGSGAWLYYALMPLSHHAPGAAETRRIWVQYASTAVSRDRSLVYPLMYVLQGIKRSIV